MALGGAALGGVKSKLHSNQRGMHLKSSFSNSKYSGQKVSPHSNLSYYDTITIVFTVLVTIFEWKTLTAVVFNRCNMVLLLHISTP